MYNLLNHWFKKEPLHPRGPSFRGAFERRKILSGCELSFKAPAPCGDSGMVIKDTDPDQIDFYDPENYEEIANDEEYQDCPTLGTPVFGSSWQFNGPPILEDYCGSVNLGVAVCKSKGFPSNESMFCPTTFARERQRYIETGPATELSNGYNPDDPWDFTPYRWPHYLAPLNWQWLNHNERLWLYHEEQPLIRRPGAHVWSTAISDEHYLQCYFSITKSKRGGGNSWLREQNLSSEPYLKLIHQIMDSLTLTLSPEAQQRCEAVTRNHTGELPPPPQLTPEQIEQAAWVMWVKSSAGNGIDEKEGVDYRADPKEVANWIQQRIKPRPLPNKVNHLNPTPISAPQPS